MSMADVLSEIERARKSKGFSSAYVSERATGNESTLKNLYASLEGPRGGGTRKRAMTLDNIQKIADFLGLEFYVGPPRDLTPAQVQPNTNQPPDYFAITRHNTAAPVTGAPDSIMISQDWFTAHDLTPALCVLVPMPDASMQPLMAPTGAAMIDRSDLGVTDRSQIYAVDVGSAVKLRHVQIAPDTITLLPANPEFGIETLNRALYATNPILGRVRAIFDPRP